MICSPLFFKSLKITRNRDFQLHIAAPTLNERKTHIQSHLTLLMLSSRPELYTIPTKRQEIVHIYIDNSNLWVQG